MSTVVAKGVQGFACGQLVSLFSMASLIMAKYLVLRDVSSPSFLNCCFYVVLSILCLSYTFRQQGKQLRQSEGRDPESTTPSGSPVVTPVSMGKLSSMDDVEEQLPSSSTPQTQQPQEQRWWCYPLVAFFDLQANCLAVRSLAFADYTSAGLMLNLTIPFVSLLGCVMRGRKYSWRHTVGYVIASAEGIALFFGSYYRPGRRELAADVRVFYGAPRGVPVRRVEHHEPTVPESAGRRHGHRVAGDDQRLGVRARDDPDGPARARASDRDRLDERDLALLYRVRRRNARLLRARVAAAAELRVVDVQSVHLGVQLVPGARVLLPLWRVAARLLLRRARARAHRTRDALRRALARREQERSECRHEIVGEATAREFQVDAHAERHEADRDPDRAGSTVSPYALYASNTTSVVYMFFSNDLKYLLLIYYHLGVSSLISPFVPLEAYCSQPPAGMGSDLDYAYDSV